MPESQAPELCATATVPPPGGAWLSEIKFDGYRIIAAVDHSVVRLLTRNGLDWAPRMPAVAAAVAALPVKTAMLDGELVSLRDDGVSSFSGLQHALTAGEDNKLVFYAFDLLHLDGWDLRACTLLERKRVLEGICDWSGMLRFSEREIGAGEAMLDHAVEAELEGIICKRVDAPYHGVRSGAWVKVKCTLREELVVLGWTPPSGSRVGFGALHVGYYDPAGILHYAGGVGTGFNAKTLLAIRSRLDALAGPAPIGMMVSGDPIESSVNWVRPNLVADISFTAWSGAGRVRHGVFLGLREDKAATEVVRDVADPRATRAVFEQGRRTTTKAHRGWHGAVPPLRAAPAVPATPPISAGPGQKLTDLAPIVVNRPTRIVVAAPPLKR